MANHVLPLWSFNWTSQSKPHDSLDQGFTQSSSKMKRFLVATNQGAPCGLARTVDGDPTNKINPLF